MNVPDSVWEFADDFDWAPRAVFDFFEDAWPDADENEKCTLFDLARGLYWYCVEWHGGQWSELYRISCHLDYRPGAGEYSPVDEHGEWTGDDEDEAPAYAYNMIAQAAGFAEDRS